MISPLTINLKEEFANLTLLENRTPHSTTEEKKDAFASLSDYRNGAIYIGYFNGSSDWERHSGGDEIVYVLEGKTKLYIKRDEVETSFELNAGEFIVVPENSWHRFETFGPVKSLTVTPMPTDHTTVGL